MSGKNTDRTRIYTSGEALARIIKADEGVEGDDRSALAASFSGRNIKVDERSTNYRRHFDLFGTGSVGAKTPLKKVSTEGQEAVMTPRTGKRTNYPGYLVILFVDLILASARHSRARDILSARDKVSSDSGFPTSADGPRRSGRVDENGNICTKRKDFSWANASRPVGLLVKNAYTDAPSLFGLLFKL
jgi:hypothetical protein